jgi:hypothetical protein
MSHAVVFEAVRFTPPHVAALSRCVRRLQRLSKTPRKIHIKRTSLDDECERWALVLPSMGPAELPILLDCLGEMNDAEIDEWVKEGTPLEKIPSIYDAGVRYQREPRGFEIWVTLRRLYKKKKGDCEDIASAWASWLRKVRRERARAVFRRRRVRRWWLYHILTQRQSGAIDDPCVDLGM